MGAKIHPPTFFLLPQLLSQLRFDWVDLVNPKKKFFEKKEKSRRMNKKNFKDFQKFLKIDDANIKILWFWRKNKLLEMIKDIKKKSFKLSIPSFKFQIQISKTKSFSKDYKNQSKFSC